MVMIDYHPVGTAVCENGTTSSEIMFFITAVTADVKQLMSVT
jgi:hypothetical protein